VGTFLKRNEEECQNGCVSRRKLQETRIWGKWGQTERVVSPGEWN